MDWTCSDRRLIQISLLRFLYNLCTDLYIFNKKKSKADDILLLYRNWIILNVSVKRGILDNFSSKFLTI